MKQDSFDYLSSSETTRQDIYRLKLARIGSRALSTAFDMGLFDVENIDKFRKNIAKKAISTALLLGAIYLSGPKNISNSSELAVSYESSSEISHNQESDSSNNKANELLNDSFQPVKLAEVSFDTRSERKVNEDSCRVGINKAVICDGVGSTKNGDVSSKLAANYLYETLDIIPNKIEEPSKATAMMREILFSSHEYIRHCQKISGNSMASTASIVKIVELNVGNEYKRYALIGNVGDSPIYIKKQNGKLIEITNYHNRRKLPNPKKRQALGKDMKIDPKVCFVRLKKGELIIVTSNGVSKNVPSKKKLQKQASKSNNPEQIAKYIVTLKKKSKDSQTTPV